MKVLISTFIIAMTVNSLTAQETPTLNITPVIEEKVPTPSPFLSDIQTVTDHLNKNELTQAIFDLNKLILKIQEKQKNIIATYLPNSFETFTSKALSESYDDNEFGHQGAMLFSRRYENPSGQRIEISILFSDPSIAEYVTIIKTPSLVKGLKNTNVIKIKDTYSALETATEDSSYIEHNIVVNKDLLINVIIHGIEDREIITRFYEQTQLEKIDNYLDR